MFAESSFQDLVILPAGKPYFRVLNITRHSQELSPLFITELLPVVECIAARRIPLAPCRGKNPQCCMLGQKNASPATSQPNNLCARKLRSRKVCPGFGKCCPSCAKNFPDRGCAHSVFSLGLQRKTRDPLPIILKQNEKQYHHLFAILSLQFRRGKIFALPKLDCKLN